MGSPSSREIERQYRVLQQTLSMHAMLRDEYAWKAKAAEITLLACAVVIIATTFASDTLYKTLGLSPDTGRVYLGIAAVATFILSLLLLVVDWKGLSAVHREAVGKWSQVLAQFRESRTENGTWLEETRSKLSTVYWEAARSTTGIPEQRFNDLKARHHRKVAISRLRDKYPACPRVLLSLFLLIRDTTNAAREPHTTDTARDAKPSQGDGHETNDAQQDPD